MSESLSYNRGLFIYEGKAKKIFQVEGRPDLIWHEFKDSFTAFNGKKKAVMEGKGRINCQMASFIFRILKKGGVFSHWVKDCGQKSMVTKKLEMIPLEVVVRNILAGSTAKKLGLSDGMRLSSPLVEFYYKKDELGDPFISEDQALLLKTVREPEDIKTLKELALKIDNVLISVFKKACLDLVDFKLEFGYLPTLGKKVPFSEGAENKILLADEISPDTCRLWDRKTGEKMDKDRFRQDLGGVIESYQEVYDRLQPLDSNYE